MNPPPIPVILNRDSGAVAKAEARLAGLIHSAFAGAGRCATIHWMGGGDIAEAVSRHARSPLIVVGGGDGTLGRALAARRGGGAIGILPLGTRNHLARDLAIPFDLAAAVAVIVSGHLRAIDLATVNAHGFVNNASIGLYPLLVRHRDFGWARHVPRWLATVPAAAMALARIPRQRFQVQRASAGDRHLHTSLLLVGNNRYLLDHGRLGQRTALDDGLLSIVAVKADTRLGLLCFALRALLCGIRPRRDLLMAESDCWLIVRSPARTVDVALDGEIRSLSTPLHFTTARRAIQLCVPAGP